MDDGFEPTRASEWIVALAAEPDDPALRARFEVWLDADPMHQRDWAEMVRTYTAIGMIVPAYRQRWQAVAAPPTPVWRRRRRNRRQTVTGVVGRDCREFCALAW